jgi:hypothetical protein
MAISAEYANRRGFQVDKSPGNRAQLELADGSIILTEGIVHGLGWEFGVGGTKTSIDFHVIEGLPVHLVLSNDFMFEWNIYSEYAELLYDADSVGDWAELCYIRFQGWYTETLQMIQDEFWRDRECSVVPTSLYPVL